MKRHLLVPVGDPNLEGFSDIKKISCMLQPPGLPLGTVVTRAWSRLEMEHAQYLKLRLDLHA